MQLLKKYFPGLSENQMEQFEKLRSLFTEYNLNVNMISRKDIENLEERHILHSLAIAKLIKFKPRTRVMDIGTGGGFPGLPLAVFFPDCKFYLVDSIGKKIAIVSALAAELGLTNVEAIHARAEATNLQVDFVVSRAVAPLADLYRWGRKSIQRERYNDLANGFILLKGGDLSEETKALKELMPPYKRYKEFELKKYFKEEFFETKKIVYIPA